MKRIKFYSAHDLSCGIYLQEIETYFQNWDENISSIDVNCTLELYNIKKYFDAGLHLERWSDAQVAEYSEKSKQIPGLLGRFGSTITADSIAEVYKEVSWNYTNDFWAFVSEYKVYRNISLEAMEDLLADSSNIVWDILHYGPLVKAYGQAIAEHLATNPLTAERMIDCYLASHEYERAQTLFPEEFTQEMRNRVLDDYVAREDGNINSLLLLEQAQSSGEFPVSDRLKLKARKKKELLQETLLASGFKMSYGAEVSFQSIPSDLSQESCKENSVVSVYSRKWLEENLDYPTLLNNFIHLFHYVDACHRCSFVSLQSNLSVFERTLGVKGKKDYPVGIVFNVRQIQSMLQMQAYRSELQRLGIRIEDVFAWFFETYLPEEFGAQGFSYSPPSEGTTYAEKCKLLVSAMDGTLKQYRLFCEDGYVDRELLEMSSGHVVFDQLKSLRTNKYVYATSEELKREMYLLFSDQSRMIYTSKVGSKYNTLPELLMGEEMIKEDFEHYQLHDLEWLIDRGTISANPNGRLVINTVRAVVLKDLYYNEVICPLYYDKNLRKEVEELVAANEVTYENTLFSKPEQQYMNYTLNKAEFSNGLDLRNRYSHDTCSQDEQTQHQDYLELLKIFVLIIIKINEEFCTKNLTLQ